MWQRGVIKYLHKKGLAPKKIHAHMGTTLRDFFLRMQQSKGCVAFFKTGKESLEVNDRCGQPTSTTTE